MPINWEIKREKKKILVDHLKRRFRKIWRIFEKKSRFEKKIKI